MNNIRSNIHNMRIGASALMMVILVAFMQILSANGQLLSSMQKLKVSSDLIPVTSYTQVIKVELNGNTIKPGDPVPARNFRNLDVQKIQWDAGSYDTRYTLILLDLDRKPGSNGSLNIYNQFTSVNIPGSSIAGGQDIVAFDPPSVPCQPSTKHRLVMLAYTQDQNIDISDIAYISAPSGPSPKRENFKLEDFVKRHRLDLAAANIFLAIGESNGICSGSMTIHSSVPMVGMIPMVIFASTVLLALSQINRRPF